MCLLVRLVRDCKPELGQVNLGENGTTVNHRSDVLYVGKGVTVRDCDLVDCPVISTGTSITGIFLDTMCRGNDQQVDEGWTTPSKHVFKHRPNNFEAF